MKKFVADHVGVVDAEKIFVGFIGLHHVPSCYVDLGAVLTALDQARAEGGAELLRALSRARWTAIQTVRAHGPSGVYAVDIALKAMEAAAEEGGAAKRRR
jgi:hypothetical protein